ncbi:MAG: hypothetical protein GEV10_20990 [Streptosporangiales bacterium]|nr:hypothetical protein [Streptosporangiales bacterium]
MDEDKTTPPSVEEQAWEDILTLTEVLARLARTDFASVPDVDGLALAAEEAVRKAPLMLQALAREIRDRGLHVDRGARSVESYLRTVLRIDTSEAKARLAAVDALHPRTQPSGEVPSGVPHTIPPKWVDPQQKPRRNRIHDPPSR